MEYIVRFRLKPNKAEEFRQWLLDNHDKLVATMPEGWTYLGTYFTLRGFGEYHCRSRWELTDYGALANPFRDPIHREVGELFSDPSYPEEVTLLRKVLPKSA